ncbi:Os01g0372866, partial [Oryza sativa Japonica Group]
MDDVPEILERELGLGQRVGGGVDLADLDDAVDAELDALLGALRRLLELALDEHGRARGGERRERVDGGVDEDLQVGGAGAIVELEEGEGAFPLLPPGLDPPAHDDALAGARGAVGQDGSDAGAVGGGLQVVGEGGRGHGGRRGVFGHGGGEGLGGGGGGGGGGEEWCRV